jgi:hypothetical protein
MTSFFDFWKKNKQRQTRTATADSCGMTTKSDGKSNKATATADLLRG